MKRHRDPEGPTFFDMWEQVAIKVAAQNIALVRERKADRRRLRSKNSRWTPGRQTLAEIGSLIGHRHGGPCDTDDGETYFRAALPWLAEKAGGLYDEESQTQILGWALALTPTMDRAAAICSIEEAHRRDERKVLYWRPQELGNLLRLSAEEREGLGIKTIRPAGMTKRQFEAYRRARKTAAEKARRVRQGATPRELSAAQQKPWETLGMAKRTYYRKQAAGTLPEQMQAVGTNSCPLDTKYLRPATGQCHVAEQAVPGPARKASPRQIVGADGHSPRSIPKFVPTGRPLPPPLPDRRHLEHPDLLCPAPTLDAIAQGIVDRYDGGIMPEALAQIVRDAVRARMLKRQDAARQIGVSPPQFANALKGRFGLSRNAATNLREWLVAA